MKREKLLSLSRNINTAQELTFYYQPANHLGIAVAVPHFTHIRPGIAGLGSLDEQARHALSEPCVWLQWSVVF